jgi:hypothetical protein
LPLPSKISRQPSQDQNRRIVGDGIAAALRASRISAFLSIKYWSTGAIFEYLSDCATAFGAWKQMLIAGTKATRSLFS